MKKIENFEEAPTRLSLIESFIDTNKASGVKITTDDVRIEFFNDLDPNHGIARVNTALGSLRSRKRNPRYFYSTKGGGIIDMNSKDEDDADIQIKFQSHLNALLTHGRNRLRDAGDPVTREKLGVGMMKKLNIAQASILNEMYGTQANYLEDGSDLQIEGGQESTEDDVPKEAVEELSSTIKEQGLINPIEVDKNFVIVTGAMRYRASKMAGIKNVPVRVIDCEDANDRFVRQVVENTSRSDFSQFETYKLVKRLAKLYPNELPRVLGARIGKSQGFIATYLNIDKDKEIRKHFLKGDLTPTKVSEIYVKVDPKYRKKIAEKVVKEDLSIPAIRLISTKIKKTDPKQVSKIISTSFKNLSTSEITLKIAHVAPDVMQKPMSAYKDFKEKAEAVEKFLVNHPNVMFKDNSYGPLMATKLLQLQEDITNYLK